MSLWQIGGEVTKLRVFFGDCDDALFVDDLAGRARVIAATITPYAKVSMPSTLHRIAMR